MKITKELLKAVMPLANEKRIDLFLPYFTKYAESFGINTKNRIAHYLAQIAHESAELHYTRELASGEKYEGRKDLGNVYKGDGKRFRGRGLIQITGRTNYSKYAQFSGFDVVKHPELLEKPLGAVRSSMWYWKTHNLNELADLGKFVSITKIINGGTNGIESRKKYLDRALLFLAK